MDIPLTLNSRKRQPREYHTEWSKSEKDKILYDIIYMQNLKKGTNEIVYKTETVYKHKVLLLRSKKLP